MDSADLTIESNNENPNTVDIKSTNFMSDSTADHVRKLILNSNMTITTTSSQQINQKKKKEESHNNTLLRVQKRQIPINESDSIATKKPKHLTEACDSKVSFNPLQALPLSLISNGTLSVTSESSCVTIENGVPILKEISDANKQTDTDNKSDISITATLAPFIEEETKNSIQENNENVKPKPATSKNKKESISAAHVNENLNINRKILKALCDITTETISFDKIGFIPNGNQIYFLTLLGLEIAVDNCCSSKNITKEAENISSEQSTLHRCMQCNVDFTTKWHFYENPAKVLCNRCFIYNERLNLKAAQTLRLAKLYTKYYTIKNLTNETATVQKTHPGAQMCENYINAARLCMKDSTVSDLTILGASIASNPEICEAANAVNSLDNTATPLARAKAVQDFQIALFKGLHRNLTPNDAHQSLLYYQMEVSKMMKNANMSLLQSENENVTPSLNAIIRAAQSQHQLLLKNIFKQMPESVNKEFQ